MDGVHGKKNKANTSSVTSTQVLKMGWRRRQLDPRRGRLLTFDDTFSSSLYDVRNMLIIVPPPTPHAAVCAVPSVVVAPRQKTEEKELKQTGLGTHLFYKYKYPRYHSQCLFYEYEACPSRCNENLSKVLSHPPHPKHADVFSRRVGEEGRRAGGPKEKQCRA